MRLIDIQIGLEELCEDNQVNRDAIRDYFEEEVYKCHDLSCDDCTIQTCQESVEVPIVCVQ